MNNYNVDFFFFVTRILSNCRSAPVLLHQCCKPLGGRRAPAMLAPTALLRLHSSKRIYCICLICVPPPAQRMGRSMQVPCDTEFPAFISERTIKENTGHVDCDGCIKYDTPAQIPAHASRPRVRGAFIYFFIATGYKIGRNCES